MKYKNLDKFNKTKKILKKFNMVLLLIHTSFIFMFYYFGIYMMVYVNIFSVLTYSILQFILAKNDKELIKGDNENVYWKKNNGMIYMMVTYIEIWLHMMFATICVGWECGFQLYYYALLTPAVFAKYVNKRIKNSITILLIAISAMVYVLLKLHTFYRNSIYELGNEKLRLYMYISNAIISFGFIMFYLMLYTRLVTSSEEKLKDKADYDNLTSIYNRNRIEYLLEHLVENMENDSNEKFYVAILDIDDFKKVNDIYGHNAGDYVLKILAQIMKKDLKDKDEIYAFGRWGGEEFLVIGKEKNNNSIFFSIIERFHQDVKNKKMVFEKEDIAITITVGIAKYENDISLKEWVEKADKCLYIGKNSGKDKIIIDRII